MLRTLKIAKMVVAAVAICFIAYLAVSGLKPDGQTEAISSKQSAVEAFRTLSGLPDHSSNKGSEFVRQAHEFALRINSPKSEVITVLDDDSELLEEISTKITHPDPPPPPPRFSLVATCRYEDYPEKSLAQLSILAKGKKWVRQGDSVGRLTIHEVKDGSIVLYQGQTMKAEIFVPPTKEIKSLLKSI